ncbi:unnamed protein product [Rotaria sordida]|uniref:RING-type domain-containing protein n=1 Tax=Rotaria sordida TaxID=392033 RepID=A0A813X581_9BILA|nr:unnamed protein product [Rotaria sordida]
MSTELNNSSQSNSGVGRLFNNVANSYIHSDSINAASRTTTSVDNDNRQSSTWVDILTQLDHAFSGSLLRVCYNIIDIILVFLGLYYGTKTCRSTLRSIFHFLKFISVCVGTIYVFTSKIPINNNCELIRFYLGIVCFSTWILIFISPPKPSLPVRRSLIMECLILALLIIVNIIYLCIVTFVTIKTKKSECIYTRIEDLYFHAPLKSFAYVGLILAGSSICTNISGAIINQLFYRRPNLRRFFIYLSAIHYVISYTITVAIVYYYSVGAILLFQPRSGGSCSRVAPNLYTTLWIWQIIRILFPLIIWPLTLIVCCLGVTLGACLTYCLPASITVPLFTMLSDRLINITSAPNENPPASPGTIDALPMVIFGQTSDEFNQAECTICRTDYKANEKVKKLPCGHIFHDSCVAQWLSITGICPVCRHRIPSAHL